MEAYKKTQKEAVMEYVEFNGSIVPAKMIGKTWNGLFFGTEITRRCRELRQSGYFKSAREGKFEKFFKANYEMVQIAREEKEQSKLFDLPIITSN